MRLKDWAEKTGIKYLTAYRWYKAGDIPGAYQTASGTILIADDTLEQTMIGTSPNSDAMSLFLKKTVEFSKNNSTVEDFAAFIISNFQIKLNVTSDNPKYSRNKPKADEVQKHFQQFLPDKNSIEHLKAVKSLIKEGKPAGDVVPVTATTAALSADGLVSEDSISQLFESSPNNPMNIHTGADAHLYEGVTTEGLGSQSVDFNTTPQQINYTGSANQSFSSSFPVNPFSTFLNANGVNAGTPISLNLVSTSATPTTFQPTQKELLTATRVLEAINEINEVTESPRKRGRKPFKKG